MADLVIAEKRLAALVARLEQHREEVVVIRVLRAPLADDAPHDLLELNGGGAESTDGGGRHAHPQAPLGTVLRGGVSVTVTFTLGDTVQSTTLETGD